MASKVPKFGAWEGGDNFTVYFDNARKVKNNGQKINPNDPEENPEFFQQNGGAVQAPPAQGRGHTEGKKTKVPEFGAWENGENVGYTAHFENAKKTKNSGPVATYNEPQLNRDMPTRSDPPPQARPTTTKPEAQAKAKLPQFGAWEEGGEVGYTVAFDNLKKKKHDPTHKEESSNAPQLNRDVAPPAQEGRAKVPQFGAWNGGDNVQYTAYFDNARKTKPGSGPVPYEPQLNRDVDHRTGPIPTATRVRHESQEDLNFRDAGRGSMGSVTGSDAASWQGRQAPGAPSKGKLQPKAPPRGSQTPDRAAIPAFGVWHNDPSKAEGFTTAFARAKVEKTTPSQHHNASPSHHYDHQKQPKNCCSIL